MSICYRCRRDDIYGSRWRGTYSRSQELVWVCPDCRDHELPVIREPHRPSLVFLWPLLGWVLLLVVTGLAAAGAF